MRLAALALTAVAVGWTFAPARGFAFLNWDDTAAIVDNGALKSSGVVAWAFTTTHLEHYQPLSWLVWAALTRAAGPTPAAFHSANVLAHIVCALLVFALMVGLFRRAAPGWSSSSADAAALAAALLYAIHPLRVEVVAWVSAFPYALALALSLLSLLAWLRTSSRAPMLWWTAAFLLFAASLLARPVALGLPIVLALLDVTVLGHRPRVSVARVWPFALAAGAAAVAESLARAPGLNETPWLSRLQSAATAPFVYVWHTVAPLRLTPLDLAPAGPVVDPQGTAAAVLALSLAAGAAWRWRARAPGLVAMLAAYLALLAPAAGLVPSGLQATADRYTYLPGVVLALGVVFAVASWAGRDPRRGRIVAALACLVIAASAVASRQALAPWSDSIALWSRVVALDAAHDVGLYNLGSALAAAGRSEEAAARYRDVLALRPDHAAARLNLDRLEAARLEREGNDAAASGNLAAAAERYAKAVGLDARRTHAQAGLGMALASLGRPADAIPALREAIRQGTTEPAVPNALAVLLIESGHAREARVVLESALAVHQRDVELAHNLARLLATDPAFVRTDAALALKLAAAVAEATGGRDPRALDTLAAAYAINGRMAEAAATSERAARLADALGEREMAVQITARGRAYRSPGQ